MGCVSSKILTRSASFREEFQKRLQRIKTGSNEEMVTSKTVTDQFVAVLCSSNTVPNKLNGHESSNQPSITKEETKAKLLAEKEAEEPQEAEKNIETINTWELLAGLEDDNEVQVEKKEELSKNLNPTKDDSEAAKEAKQGESKKEGGGEKGLRRKAMAKDLTSVKVPKFEFLRTGSLRDWLSHGGQAFSPGSYVTPRFGSFQPEAANRSGEENEMVVFDPKLVAQLEEAMEEMTNEEEEILRKIV